MVWRLGIALRTQPCVCFAERAGVTTVSLGNQHSRSCTCLMACLLACASHMESYEPTNNHMHAEEAKVEARAGGKDW